MLQPAMGAAAAPGRAPVQPEEEEMNIEFDDDESPKQPQQQRPARAATPQNASIPVSLVPYTCAALSL